MNKPRILLLLGMLAVLSLVTGCYREAAPDVTPTLAGGAQIAPSEEGTPDPTEMAATAEANSDLATQAAQEAEAPATATLSPPSPTPTPVPASETPAPTPTTPAAETPAPTSPPSPVGQVTHVVQRGENLFRIALRYGVSVNTVANANGIANPALIYVGQKLVVSPQGAQPPSAGATTYTVQPGDNLFRIALRYNLSYLYLAQYNGIANPSSIYAGQILSIPSH